MTSSLFRHQGLRALRIVPAVAGLLFLAACGKEQAAAPQLGALPVSTLTVAPQEVSLSRELPGRVTAFRIAEVRARINGIVQKRLFEEGADVKEGDVLFEIDPAPYQAALDSAKATLARAEANLASAKAQAARYKDLVSTNAISRQNYDDAVAAQLAFTADVAAGQAAVRAAEINLGYTRVTAPISGRIGRAEVTEGAYVQQGAATLLATIQQLDPVYVDLNQSAEELLQLKAALAAGRIQRSDDGAKISLAFGANEYAHAGTLQFSDVTVNPTTGTVTLRGIFPNPDAQLLPGMYVRARLEEGVASNSILVPQSIVARNARGETTVYVVGENNTAELRPITVARSVGSQWLVSAGLKPGERVIADNLQKIRPGAPVNPLPAAQPAQ